MEILLSFPSVGASTSRTENTKVKRNEFDQGQIPNESPDTIFKYINICINFKNSNKVLEVWTLSKLAWPYGSCGSYLQNIGS